MIDLHFSRMHCTDFDTVVALPKYAPVQDAIASDVHSGFSRSYDLYRRDHVVKWYLKLVGKYDLRVRRRVKALHSSTMLGGQEPRTVGHSSAAHPNV